MLIKWIKYNKMIKKITIALIKINELINMNLLKKIKWVKSDK